MKIDWESDTAIYEMMREHLYTAVVGDIMDEMELYHQFLPARIRPLKDDMVLIGRAMTVLEGDMFSAGCGANNQLLGQPFGLMLDALDDLKKDEIYLTSGSSATYALVGELMCMRAKYLEAGGAVANGYIRDTNGILALNFPVFSYGSYAQDQAPRGKVLDYRVPIIVGEVHVNPGDIVFGDIDGVLTIPRKYEQEILERAYAKATGEKTVATAIQDGLPAKLSFEKFGIM